jgi:hypothetical protein
VPVSVVGLLSKSELREQASERGAAFTESQLDRLRERGLILIDAHEAIPGHGSVSGYAPDMVENLVAISELPQYRRKHKRLGFELWWRGYRVSAANWMPSLTRGAKIVQFIPHACRYLLDRRDKDDNFADRSSSGSFDVSKMPGPFRKPFLNVGRSLPDNPTWSVIWGFIEAIDKQPPDLKTHVDEDRGYAIPETFLALNGAQRSRVDRVMSSRFEIVETLPEFLAALESLQDAPTPAELFARENAERLIAAREDVCHSLGICDDFHAAMNWIYGKDAFGLRIAAWLARNATPEMRAAMVVGWMAIRHHPMFLVSRDIAELADKTSRIRHMSAELHRRIESHPTARAAITPARVKLAFQSVGGPEKLGSELEQLRLS